MKRTISTHLIAVTALASICFSILAYVPANKFLLDSFSTSSVITLADDAPEEKNYTDRILRFGTL